MKTKYDIKQEVFYIKYFQTNCQYLIDEVCEHCNGTFKQLVWGKEITCPNCLEGRQVIRPFSEGVAHFYSFKIAEITITEGKIIYHDALEGYDYDSWRRSMNEQDLYTKEEAQFACKVHNDKLVEDILIKYNLYITPIPDGVFYRNLSVAYKVGDEFQKLELIKSHRRINENHKSI